MARTKGARGIGEAERRLIRLALDAKTPIAQIAEGLGRSRVTIWKQIKRMEAQGDFAQVMLPLEPGADHGKI